MKKSLSIFLVGLFLFSILINIGVVSALDCWDNGDGLVKNIWGCVSTNLVPDVTDSATQSLFVLIMAIVLIYSTLGIVGLPENAGLRFLFAVAAGLLAISALGNSIGNMVQSFQALGAVFTIGIPILIMTFFTFTVAIKGHFMGVVAQRILWLIYSVYLFFKTAGVWALMKVTENTTFGNLRVVAYLENFFKFNSKTHVVDSDAAGIGLLVQFIVSIAIFWIFFVKNEAVTKWLSDQQFANNMKAVIDNLKSSQSLRKAEADAVKNAGN